MLDIHIIFFRLKLYLQFRRKSKSREGHGIHSPFVFEFVRHCLAKTKTNQYNDFYNNLSHFVKTLPVTSSIAEHGAGHNNSGKSISPALFIKESSVTQHWGKLLYRIAKHYPSQNILEMGTGIGISSSIMKNAATQANLTSLEGNPAMAQLAKQVWQCASVQVNLLEGEFDTTLPKALRNNTKWDLVYIDGNHRKEATIRYIQQILPHTHNNTILILDDINWSRPMQEAWFEIKEMTDFTATIDLYRMGILFRRKELYKEHFYIRY